MSAIGQSAPFRREGNAMGSVEHATGDLTLLIVDDEWLISAPIGAYFRDLGFTVLLARSADGAIEYLTRTRGDLVVSDISMPGTMNGLGLAQWIRRELPAVPVVLMSGASKAADVAEALGPAVPFFKKPCDFGRLETCVREQLRAA
ncbi:response regulator [Reyranella sp.]|uniref:response regulator n=1 Tax=Reyranella sp. TaxID=1929291 RepID=UPI0027305339|nr:response regulator [Reyranella sp.]MDP2375384.1 response regulator [Reyranella sp.]